MSRFHLIYRRYLNRTFISSHNPAILSVQSSGFCTRDDAGGTKNKPEGKDDQKRNKEALKKLNDLLTKMVQEDVVEAESTIELAKPKNRRTTKEENANNPKVETLEEKTLIALKSVAESIGGDVKQTESELLLKLLKPSDKNKSEDGGLSEIVKGMKIDRSPKSNQPESRANQVRQILGGMRGTIQSTEHRPRSRPQRLPKVPRKDLVIEKIDLFGAEPLGIFTSSPETESEGPRNEFWDVLYAKELRLAVTHPPDNHFQQLILWTKQGKLWRFPIDNEQGLDQEKQVYFADHVFLDRFIQSWCPREGPIRHFMELVCVGLSKNPYLSVQAKKEHLDWFRDYFQAKKQLLQDVGALRADNIKEIESESKL